jgi:glutamate dehydrogenase
MDKLTTHEQKLDIAIKNESKKFLEFYNWLEGNMPPAFFEEIGQDNLILITHSLMGLDRQEYTSTINLPRAALAICLDSPDADLQILQNYALYGIKNYTTFVSKTPPPFPGVSANLYIGYINFTEAIESPEHESTLSQNKELRDLYLKHKKTTQAEFIRVINSIDDRFLKGLSLEQQVLALDMLERAETRDNCQYEYSYDDKWSIEKDEQPSMHVVLAWKNTPKYHFLYRVARVVQRHGLDIRGVHATYVNTNNKDSILVMVLGLHGSKGEPAWEAANIPDFLRELVTTKYFASFDTIDTRLVEKGIISGNNGNLMRAMVNFIHQSLVHIDSNLYSLGHIEEDICYHPELTAKICDLFKFKFDPDHVNLGEYEHIRKQLITDITRLDTGNEEIDNRRRNVLRQAVNFVHYTLKTNFYRNNYTALIFRLDPKYLDDIPFDRSKLFPELPYAIFFMRGMHYIAFHIRFKDLARGGLRTIFPDRSERVIEERNTVFRECYSLAYTQHFKNKDIPEGGAKAVIFVKPYERIEFESEILRKELESAHMNSNDIKQRIKIFLNDQKAEVLQQAQRSFIDNLLLLINCHPDGTLKAKYILDYYKKPEYLYLGPDENMNPAVIRWIADTSIRVGYKPGSSFISSKPQRGINHKEYGVTSLGLNVYMHEVLKYMGIDPSKDVFTIKMTGGPDGDVAGNQMLNFLKFYPKTSRLLATIDVSGTINDPHGLDLNILSDLFKKEKPISHYPYQKLSEGGFLLDRNKKRNDGALAQQTLCLKKNGGVIVEEWLSGSDMNHILRDNINKTVVDVFIPGGGRPRTLNESNVKEFLDDKGVPTAKAIIEGANLYLDMPARNFLEKQGVLIVIDSSANKTGVICSSFEVLAGLTLGDELFAENKEQLVKEILERIQTCALNEARLLLKTHQESGGYLTEISFKISKRINQFKYQLLDYLDTIKLSNDLNDPLIQNFLNYSLPTLRDKYPDLLMKEIPEHHKKAIIACNISAHLVYTRGLNWFPSIVDVLSVVL